MRHGITAAIGAAVLVGVAATAWAQDPGGPPRPGAMRPGPERMLQERFAMMDANHDGVVTRAEYDGFRAQRRARMEARMKDRSDREFATRDANHDSRLSRDEFAPAPPPGGPGARGGPRGEMDWFAIADANGDGRVTLAEAQTAMERMMGRMRGPGGPGGPPRRGSGSPPPPPLSRGDGTGPGYELPAGGGAPAGYDPGAAPPQL